MPTGFTKTTVAMIIMVLVAIVTLGLIAYLTVTRQAIPDVINTLLGVVVGFLGTSLSSEQGARQALATPPDTTNVRSSSGLDEGVTS